MFMKHYLNLYERQLVQTFLVGISKIIMNYLVTGVNSYVLGGN